MSLLVNILAFVGFLIVLSVIYYFYRRYADKKKKQTKLDDMWPPRQYMKDIGAQCPDYWTMSNGSSRDMVRCTNTFNIPAHGDDCQSENDRTIEFTRINKWPVKRDSNHVKERCKWINKCGPHKHSPASWVGMNQFC